MKDNTIKQILGVMYADNHVQLDPIKVRDALQLDLDAGASEPTFAEIDVIIMGDDEGFISPDVKKKWPNLDAFLETHF